MTHDIAKIDNYSVYRRLGNNLDYRVYKQGMKTITPYIDGWVIIWTIGSTNKT